MSTVAVLNPFYHKTATVVRPCYCRIVNTERRSVHYNSRTTAVQQLKAGVILRTSIDRVRVFSISSSALLQQVFSHFGVTLLQLRASFRAIFEQVCSAVIEQVFKRFWSKFLGDFGASSSAILKPVRPFWKKFSSDFGGNSSTILHEVLQRLSSNLSG